MNCKPGDMAIVMRADAAPEAVGRLVKVLSRCGDVNGRPSWTVRFQSVVVARNRFDGSLMMGSEAPCPDAWLMPVGGAPVTNDIAHEVSV
ncbi:hypothetical protein [Burkholderia cepacia]|uniref:hypothetical protein n=1 Tax=Burkholderia cepacia TaxID=292 RepID=UPI001F1D2F50|nr:hypothetical protein [Burkholderia cepacia]MCE4125787.1 hypothetical protein [Burkholderia cepacia]